MCVLISPLRDLQFEEQLACEGHKVRCSPALSCVNESHAAGVQHKVASFITRDLGMSKPGLNEYEKEMRCVCSYGHRLSVNGHTINRYGGCCPGGKTVVENQSKEKGLLYIEYFFASGNFVMCVLSLQIIDKMYLKQTEPGRGSLSRTFLPRQPGSDSRARLRKNKAMVPHSSTLPPAGCSATRRHGLWVLLFTLSVLPFCPSAGRSRNRFSKFSCGLGAFAYALLSL